MKIIFGVDYLSRKNTGISSLVENLTVNLSKEGHSIYIAAIADEYSHSDKSKFQDAQILLIKKQPWPFSVLKIIKSYINFFINSDAHIAHIHSLWSLSTIAIYFWARMKKKPYVISSNGMMNDWALNQSKIKKKIFLSIIFKRIIAGSKAVIVNSSNERIYLTEKGWHTNFYVIPNGVNVSLAKRNNLQSINTNKRLLFLSRIHKKKGIEILLDAWNELYPVTKQNNWELLVIGFLDPEKNEYEKYISEKIKNEPGLANVSVSAGKFGDEMWDQYNCCDAFILPTFSEGSAMVVLNAWTVGKVCLTTVGSNLEIGLDKSCTILIEPNIDSVKNGILKLMNLSDAQIIKFGQVGKKIVQENYTWQKIATKHIEIYRDVITKQFG